MSCFLMVSTQTSPHMFANLLYRRCAILNVLSYLMIMVDHKTTGCDERKKSLEIIEAEFATVYSDITEITFPQTRYMSYRARSVLCVEIYELYSGIHLGDVLRGPYYSATVVSPQKLLFKRISAQPKTVHAMFCGLSQMVFTHYFDIVEDIFIFKGLYQNTMYILKGDAGLDSEFLLLHEEVYGIEFKDYVDIRD